ncbi:MAG TPA: nitrate/sulfonate/bicarbonate ABC transporter ATP-binding protein, partial [Firmicutes bacterium]|nr:nitrate/sulfonate/bicarbonate ABC transporter ATP-binding protein [Bacillota bacterium]
MSLIVENVSKSFATKRQQIHTLDNVSAEFKQGEFVCILG